MSRRKAIHRKDTLGERAASALASTVGSWRFILAQAGFIVGWMVSGGYGHDPMPWLLLNVCLSLQAAFTGPILQLSSNRQEQINQRRDDLEAEEVENMYAMVNELHAINATQLEILHLLKAHLVRDLP